MNQRQILGLVMLMVLMARCEQTNDELSQNNLRVVRKQPKYVKKRLIDITNIELEYHSYINGTKNQTLFVNKQKNNTGQLYIDLKNRGWKFIMDNKTGMEIKNRKKIHQLLKQFFKNKSIGFFKMRDFNSIKVLKLREANSYNPYFEVSLLKDGIRIDAFSELCVDECASMQQLTIKFSIKNKQSLQLVWGYNYILDGRKLGEINKE